MCQVARASASPGEWGAVPGFTENMAGLDMHRILLSVLSLASQWNVTCFESRSTLPCLSVGRITLLVQSRRYTPGCTFSKLIVLVADPLRI